MGHVNNTVYLDWFDEALATALRDAGLPLTPPGGPGLRLVGAEYQIDYLRSALPGDNLTINSQLTGSADGGMALVWSKEIQHDEGEVLVRCVSRQQLRGLEADGLTSTEVLAALTTA